MEQRYLEFCQSRFETATQHFSFKVRLRFVHGASAAAVAGELFDQIDKVADLLPAVPIIRGQYL